MKSQKMVTTGKVVSVSVLALPRTCDTRDCFLLRLCLKVSIKCIMHVFYSIEGRTNQPSMLLYNVYNGCDIIIGISVLGAGLVFGLRPETRFEYLSEPGDGGCMEIQSPCTLLGDFPLQHRNIKIVFLDCDFHRETNSKWATVKDRHMQKKDISIVKYGNHVHCTYRK